MSIKTKTLKKKQIKTWREDPIFNSTWITKFINKFMKQGKKTIAEKAVMMAFYKVKKNVYKKPVLLLLNLMLRLKPILSIIIRRKGKQFIDLPIPLTPKQQLMFSLKWIVMAIRMRRFGTLNERIAAELSESISSKRTFLLTKYNNFIERVFNSRLNSHFKYKRKRRTKK